jgi:hypothetical protein
MRLIYGGGGFYWMGYEILCVLGREGGVYGFYCANLNYTILRYQHEISYVVYYIGINTRSLMLFIT